MRKLNEAQKAGLVISFVMLCALIALLASKPAKADELQPAMEQALPPIVPVVLAATLDLTRLAGAPEFRMMTTSQMKADGCADPAKCPTLVSVHPPMAPFIIVNSDIDIAHDLNAQGQLVHVIAMFLIEKAGRYSPDMPCDLVMRIEAFADQVQMAYLDAMSQQYMQAGLTPPPVVKPQVWTFCTPDSTPAVEGEF